MSYPLEIKRALRIITISQCVGMLGPLLFGNGFMLAYLLRLNIPSFRILFLFALMPLLSTALTLPLAWLADCSGKKKMGGTGMALCIIGFFMLPLAALMQTVATGWLTAGILIFATGNAAIGASWFALLSPIVPEEIRGRWFGQMRTAWQVISILFSFGLTALLHHHPAIFVFQIVLLITGILMVLRMLLYLKIPELEPVRPPQHGIFRTLDGIFRIPGYLRFCIYCFLLAIAGSAGGLFGLLEKDVLGFSDSQLVMMGNMMSIGAVAGFLGGGKMVDHVGTKPVFLTSHIAAFLTLAGILLRGWIPLPLPVTMGVLSLIFGALQGATGIAGTSELLALIPSENKSLSTGFNLTLSAAGLSLAGLLNSQLLKINVLPKTWHFSGQMLSDYDLLLAGFTIISLLLAAALGLVPTIRNLRSQWLPQSR